MRPSRSLRRARRRAPSRSSSRFHPRGLSLSLPLDIVPPLFPRVPSLFFNPRFLLARSSASALCRTLSVSSRARPSPPVSIPVRIGASSAPLSRRRSSFEASLSAAVHNHPPAARSVLVEFAIPGSPLRHRAHLRILLARALHPFRRSVPVSIRSETALYFSLLFSPPSRLPFPSPSLSLSPLFSFSDQRFFARRLCIVWCLVCGTYIIQARGCVRVHPGRPSRAHLARRGETRVFESLRYAFMGKKKWADVSSALVTAACKYAAAEGARTRHACTGSVEELLPFLSASFLYRPGFSNIFARYPLRRGI